MTWLFWVSAAAIVYVYVGYPALLRVWARFGTRLSTRGDAPASVTPGISIVIAAHNEAARLPARIDNLLSLDYPASRRQIIVVSDGSTDNTVDVVRTYASLVDLVEVERGGKAAALNAARPHARFDIVVFADARQVFAPNALRELAAPFADPAIGGVTGELLLDCESALFSNRRASADRRRGHASQLGAAAIERRVQPDRRRSIVSTIADGVGIYWRYEKELRRLESAVGSTLGATGAIYAVRRVLWQPLPAETLLDDVLTPMRVVMAGYRVVFNERARAFDRAAPDAEAESRRKVRTLAGNYQILWLEPGLLLPWRNPVWIQYLSHKLGRLTVPYALIALFAANIAIASTRLIYQASLVAQIGFYLLAGYGAVIEFMSRAEATGAAASAHGTASSAPEAAKGAA
jgi:cellulose synthase/poly-beta-1,6-N-acetylglucosamine synthase-like glycosyltransferase